MGYLRINQPPLLKNDHFEKTVTVIFTKNGRSFVQNDNYFSFLNDGHFWHTKMTINSKNIMSKLTVISNQNDRYSNQNYRYMLNGSKRPFW